MTKQGNTIKVISYGDAQAQFFLWDKAILIVPMWAIPLIPLLGLVCKTMGPVATQVGYGLVIVVCFNYFFEDLLKRKIRMDDEYIFFGFRAIPIRDIASVDITYKKRKLLPNDLVISCLSGKTLKLSLNAMSETSAEIIVRHLQSRNSNLKTAPVLSTLIKCRRITRKSAIDTPEQLLVPYHGRRLLDESLEVFRSSAVRWIRPGPLIACFLLGPVWMNWVSALYLCLQPNAIQYMESLNLHHFLVQCFEGLQHLILGKGTNASTSMQQFAESPAVLLLTTGFITVVLIYLYRLFCRPNVLSANSKGMALELRFGELALPLGSIRWSEIGDALLVKPPRSAGAERWKIRLQNKLRKHFDLDLCALTPEDRVRLLKRLERMAPDCRIEPELSQSLHPKAEHSYTELWLQSLTQAPERKTLDPLEPGQLIGDERFQVIKRLGVGGQGTAYLCHSIQSGEYDKNATVVLKETILPVFVDSQLRRAALEKFEEEARMLQSLDSDQIVKLVDYFIEDHRAYLVLEHIDGCNLRELVLKEGPLPSEKVRHLGLQMCRILELLHANSVIHRDFTPDNLILNAAGKLKLIDFNVAQQLKTGTTGTIVGKHAYLPPEQFRGKATTQSDLYAMGATLHFLLTGTDPEPISQSSPASMNAHVDADLDGIVRHATALQTDKRYSRAEDIETDLSSCRHSEKWEAENLEVAIDG